MEWVMDLLLSCLACRPVGFAGQWKEQEQGAKPE